jgi:transposase-like protein
MARSKITQAKLDELREAYEKWNPYAPDSPSADELAEQYGISKQTMYYWRRRDWKMNGREGMKGREKASNNDLSDVVMALVEQLAQARVENEQLRQAALLDVQAERERSERYVAEMVEDGTSGGGGRRQVGSGQTDRDIHRPGSSADR